MTKKTVRHITIISFIIGFMLAVQYNTVQNPEKIESTDIWEIRQNLADEKRLHAELLSEIREVEGVIEQYETEEADDPERILAKTVQQLKQAIGQAEVKGPGVKIRITPAQELIDFGYELEEIPPSLLIRLVNDIYRYDGQYIDIAGERVTPFTAIRDINGQTTVNGEPIGRANIEMNVVLTSSEQATKLYNHLLASSFMDEFYIDNMNLTIELSAVDLTISATDRIVENTYLKEDKGE